MKRGRKSSPFTGMTKLELRALEMQINNEIRSRRIQAVLRTLAATKEKDFNLIRFETDLSNNIEFRCVQGIDKALDILEALLDIY